MGRGKRVRKQVEDNRERESEKRAALDLLIRDAGGSSLTNALRDEIDAELRTSKRR